MARQHSGETQGSFIAEGVMEFLMENGENDYLKKNFTYIIIPMVNVDGVFYGNYRTNVSGYDLNRIWRYPNKDLHPEVYFIKKYLQNIQKTYPISIIIDIHGHSKSLNSFFFHLLEFFPFKCLKSFIMILRFLLILMKIIQWNFIKLFFIVKRYLKT